jgi:ribosomal protein S18 acetylase RimI-like enzyme
MVPTINIVAAGTDRIDELVDFWLLLHAFQGALAAPIPGLPLRTNSDTGPMVQAQYLEWLSQPDSFAFLAEVDEKTVGYIIGFVQDPSEIWDTGRIGHIDSFLVLPEMRGQGVGSLLMEAAYDHMRSVGVTTVGLDVFPNNEGARRFYDNEGFTPSLLHMYRSVPTSPQRSTES